jgi:hypothetical protein
MVDYDHIGIRDDVDMKTVYLRPEYIEECLQNAIFRSATSNQGRER